MQFGRRMNLVKPSRTVGALPLALLVVLGCRSEAEIGAPPPPAALPTAIPIESEDLAAALDQALTSACPVGALDDDQAHRACADALTALSPLAERMDDPFDWGGQSAPGQLDFAQSNRTDLNPRIFRRLYLATFAFPGGHSVETQGETTIVHIPVVFRDGLDPGAFPYPFWHSPDKWASYETAREILFFIRGGRMIGALRSADRDGTRPRREMKWDGRWTWEDSAGMQPRVALFSYAFSPGNPHVVHLEESYRALEKQLRAENCMTCHSPDNLARMNPLELFSYPNQALSGRHQLIGVLIQNTMPPGAGIPDVTRRAQLLELAQQFVEAGDAAFSFDETPARSAP
jgi:hypothetical protein